jgi:hypothetical protein
MTPGITITRDRCDDVEITMSHRVANVEFRPGGIHVVMEYRHLRELRDTIIEFLGADQ